HGTHSAPMLTSGRCSLLGDVDLLDDDGLGRLVHRAGGHALDGVDDLWLASSATSPKMVCLPLSHGVSAVVMKNCEPLVPRPICLPALAMASRYLRSNWSSGWISSSKVYPGPPVPVPSGQPPWIMKFEMMRWK